jgi:hypothetical protein
MSENRPVRAFTQRSGHPVVAVALLGLVAGVIAACGDVGTGEPGSTTIEVYTPSPDLQGAELAARLRFSIDCAGVDWDPFDDTILEGPFEKTDDDTLNGMDVWRALAMLPPGPCAIRVQGFAFDNRQTCGMSETFSVSPVASTEIGLVLLCSGGIRASD